MGTQLDEFRLNNLDKFYLGFLIESENFESVLNSYYDYFKKFLTENRDIFGCADDFDFLINYFNNLITFNDQFFDTFYKVLDSKDSRCDFLYRYS